MDPSIAIRPAAAGDDVAGWIRRSWAGTTMAVHGQLYDVATLPTPSRRRAGISPGS